MNLSLSRTDLTNLALVTSAAASEAYADERLATAATYHQLAARLWYQLGGLAKAKTHAVLAQAIDNEQLAIAAGDTEEAEYVASTIREAV